MTAATDRPRERLWRLGAGALTGPELLAILLGTGDGRRDALLMATWRRGRPRGSSITRTAGAGRPLVRLNPACGTWGVTCSMSHSGNVWDNSAMGSSFSTLHPERTAARTYRTRGAARADVFDSIERWYNPVRRHSTLGYVSPVQFEQQAQVA